MLAAPVSPRAMADVWNYLQSVAVDRQVTVTVRQIEKSVANQMSTATITRALHRLESDGNILVQRSGNFQPLQVELVNAPEGGALPIDVMMKAAQNQADVIIERLSSTGAAVQELHQQWQSSLRLASVKAEQWDQFGAAITQVARVNGGLQITVKAAPDSQFMRTLDHLAAQEDS